LRTWSNSFGVGAADVRFWIRALWDEALQRPLWDDVLKLVAGEGGRKIRRRTGVKAPKRFASITSPKPLDCLVSMFMKYALVVAALSVLATPAFADEVGVGVGVGPSDRWSKPDIAAVTY
jgi:hypothetical protein